MKSYEIDIANRQTSISVDSSPLQLAVEAGLQLEGIQQAVLSVTIVDNATIHQLNRQHLQHDYPTDVISFQLGCETAADGSAIAVEGEIVVSAEYAAESAARLDWSPLEELTLYVVHGLLHICGYDDHETDDQARMRDRERAILTALGLTPVYPDQPPFAEAADSTRPSASTTGAPSRQAPQEDHR